MIFILKPMINMGGSDLNPFLAFTGYTIQRGRLANQELQFINQPLRDNKEGKEHVFAYLLDQKFKLSY
jgi:hypothetical protein